MDPDTYRSVLPRALARNMRRLHPLLVLGALFGAAYVLLSVVSLVSFDRFFAPYCFLLVACVALLLVGRRMDATRTRGMIVYQYLCLVSALAYSVILGLLSHPYPAVAVTYPVLVVALSLLFVDVPRRFDALVLVTGAIFTAIALGVPMDAGVRATDIQNAATFSLVAMLANWSTARSNFAEIASELDVERQRDYDQLTQLFSKEATRLRIDAALVREVQGSFVIIDLDHFKQVNDTYGHLFGDRVIACMGEAVLEQVRRGDIAGRFGGDEFVLFLPNAMPDAAAGVVRRISRSFSDKVCNIMGEADLTMSAGIVGTDCGTSFSALFKGADKALYDAKAAGRGRIARGGRNGAPSMIYG